MKKIILILLTSFLSFAIFAESHFSTQSHQAQVTNIIPAIGQENDGSYFSTSEDGFVIKWSDDNQGEHYQFTDEGIKLIALSPNGKYIAIYESDGGSINKVSVWDWTTLNRKFYKKFKDSITALKFSAKGNYLIIGTATVDGAVFYRTSDWKPVDKIKTNTSIVNYINTSETEKTAIFYSPAGSLTYYNLTNGNVKKKFKIIQGLSQVIMFNNDKFIAGVKDNQIYIINAFLGNSVSSVSANNPIILSRENDYNLYYLEYDGRNTYELKMLESNEDNTVSNPRIVKVMKGPRASSAICTGVKSHGNLYFGDKTGAIYKTDTDALTSTENLKELTEDIYSKIYGMTPSDTDFYFLTENSIYKSSYDTGLVNKLYNTQGQREITQYKDNNVILWSKASKVPVQKIDLDKQSSEVLFTPKGNVQNLKICSLHQKDYIIEIESNTTVNLYDIETKTLKEIYSGMGVQDAILTNDGNIYIAKSAATNPQVPLLSVNINTMETVPIKIRGNVAYALSTDGTTIYGINVISDEDGRNTYVFSYNVNSKQMTNILKFADEDAEAFTYLYENNLFTNIGKNKVYCYNISSKKRFSYNRSASIPQSICQNGKRVVILNNNGSISWCGANDSKLLADWYLTKEDQWYEF